MSRRDRAKIVAVVIILAFVGLVVLLDWLMIDPVDLQELSRELNKLKLKKPDANAGYKFNTSWVENERCILVIGLRELSDEAIAAFKKDYPKLPYKHVEFRLDFSGAVPTSLDGK